MGRVQGKVPDARRAVGAAQVICFLSRYYDFSSELLEYMT